MIKRVIKTIFFRIKYRTCKIMGDCSLSSVFEGKNVVWDKTKFNGSLGFGSYISRFSDIDGKVGRYCSIGSNVKTIISSHPSRCFVSTHPAFYSQQNYTGLHYVDKQKFSEHIFADSDRHGVIIGNDVWIGDNVSIMGGVQIGDGCIIGANSLVTKSIKPYTIAAGIPAKEIRMRFDEDSIAWLEQLKWWNKTEDWIKQNADYFDDIDRLKKHIMENE